MLSWARLSIQVVDSKLAATLMGVYEQFKCLWMGLASLPERTQQETTKQDAIDGPRENLKSCIA